MEICVFWSEFHVIHITQGHPHEPINGVKITTKEMSTIWTSCVNLWEYHTCVIDTHAHEVVGKMK